jgi:hypothetical protein
MLFEARLRDGLADGSITVAFRRWQRPQVLAGRRYRTGGRYRMNMGDPLVEVERVDVVAPEKITKVDARRAGFSSPEALLASLRGDPALPLYRVRFKKVDDPDPRDVLAHSLDDLAGIDARLARLDRAAEDGPWTARVLQTIAEHPEVVSTELAQGLGLERLIFKRRVRALKELGLTLSLTVGYRISPRGAAYLSWRNSAEGTASARA